VLSAHGRIIDAWMQHPTPRLRADPMFESLRRWVPTTTLAGPDSLPLAATIEAMDTAGVRLGLVCAWWGPRGPLIDNDEVAALVREYPDRLVGVASVDLARPLAAVRELRRAVRGLGFRALRVLPWLWNLPPDDRRYTLCIRSASSSTSHSASKSVTRARSRPPSRVGRSPTWITWRWSSPTYESWAATSDTRGRPR
jgi:predicted TIM-barrel fold metal-dependent hydrolase